MNNSGLSQSEKKSAVIRWFALLALVALFTNVAKAANVNGEKPSDIETSVQIQGRSNQNGAASVTTDTLNNDDALVAQFATATYCRTRFGDYLFAPAPSGWPCWVQVGVFTYSGFTVNY